MKGFFRIYITKGDKVVFSGKTDKQNFLKLWFKNLETNITNHPDWSAEEINSAYDMLWNNFTVLSDYVDSYGHIWKDTNLSKSAKLQYLCNQLQLLKK